MAFRAALLHQMTAGIAGGAFAAEYLRESPPHLQTGADALPQRARNVWFGP